jgi:DNA glycosylase AlkZ-like
MEGKDIAGARLSSQRIIPRTNTTSPEDVLTSLGAVQAQDYPAALWAIGLRCGGSVTKADVEATIAKRIISRTWLMRGTLHFASSRDIHWMLRLFAPRLISTAIARDRNLGLGDDAVRKAEDLFAKALRGNRQLTRDEMYEVLEKGGVNIAGPLGYHMLYRAAWDGVICFGAHEGKQPTFELLHERIGRRRELTNEQALAELASRYFTSHGPATVKDYVWWSGLKTSDAKAGIEAASKRLSSERIDGKTYYMARRPPKPEGNDGSVHLLPAFDEFLVGYSDRSAVLGNEDTQRMLRSGKIFFTHSNGIFLPVVVADCEVVGTWKRRNEKGKVTVSIMPLVKFDEERLKGIREAAKRYGEFLEAPIAVAFDD